MSNIELQGVVIHDGDSKEVVPNTVTKVGEQKSDDVLPNNATGMLMHLRFKNICFDVVDEQAKEGEKDKRILHSVSGQIKAGRSLAVLGPSGSGKTSLLNILSDRTQQGVTGEVLLNGQPLPLAYKRITGYVTQDDLWLESLTVRETLSFAAELKMANDLTTEDRMNKIEELIKTLDMEACIDTYIGKLGEGISGGERKRLSIGLELLSDPGLIFLDEPTSGLDSTSALMLAELLRELCVTRGTSVVSTIHQPRFELLNQFDEMLLLAQGKIVYFGPVADVLGYFKTAGFDCPQFVNPADFVLDVVNTTTGNRDENVQKLHDQYQSSQLKVKADSEPVGVIASHFDKSNACITENGVKFQTSFFTQFWVIFRRSFMHKLREPIAVATQGFNAIVMTFIIGTIYWQLGSTQSAVVDMTRGIALICLMQSFFAFDIVILFPVERALYQREHSGGLYSTRAYYWGRSGAEAPGHIIFALVAANIAYFTMGFANETEKWLWFNLFIVLVTQAGASLLLFCGSVAKNLEQSNMLASLLLIVFMLFDGTWVSVNQIPTVYSWIQYCSFMGFGVKGLLKSQLVGQTFTCTDDELVTYGGVCPITTGEQVLESMGFASISPAVSAWVLVAMIIVYRIFAYFGLKYTNTKKPFAQLWAEN